MAFVRGSERRGGGIALAFAAATYAGRARPWYEAKLVETGSGRLDG